LIDKRMKIRCLVFCEHGSGGSEGGPACQLCLARHVKLHYRSEQTRDPSGGRVVRTVYVPNESVETLLKVVQVLRTQLQEQSELHEQRQQAATEDRLINQTEHAEALARAAQNNNELMAEHTRLQDLHRATTKDYMLLRHASQATERMLRERLAEAAQNEQRVQDDFSRVLEEKRRKQQMLAQESDEFVDLLRQQTLRSDEDLNVVKSQYSAAQELYERRIRYLEERVATGKNKYEVLEQRRAREIEGFESELNLLRQRVRQQEKQLAGARLQKVAITRERREMGLPDATSSSLVAGRGLDSAADELAAVQAQLEQLQARIRLSDA